MAHPAGHRAHGVLRLAMWSGPRNVSTAFMRAWGNREDTLVVDAQHRIDPAVVRRDFERAGFVFDGESRVLANPADDHSKAVFDESVRGSTDRFLYRFRKPAT